VEQESSPVMALPNRDKAEKSFNIGDMARRPSSKKRIIDEMKKCDVLCVNCHAKLH
jgi:hypothetical protein